MITFASRGMKGRRHVWVQSAVGAVLCLSLFGCQDGQLPDPNDPRDVPQDQIAKVLRKNIQQAADSFNQRVMTGEISDGYRRKLLADLADKELAMGDPAHSAPADCWIYADLMLTAGRFQDAIPLLKRAVEYAVAAKNDDRRVNDSLRLAHAYAETGKVKEALDLAQKVIDSKPGDPGPVLPSVLLEITPAAQGKGHDLQLAHLLEEAIHEHLLMKVDPNTVPGRMFLLARSHHIYHAWQDIVELLNQSGHHDLAAAAEQREAKMMQALVGGPPTSV